MPSCGKDNIESAFPWLSKWDFWASSIRIAWSRVRNTDSQIPSLTSEPETGEGGKGRGASSATRSLSTLYSAEELSAPVGQKAEPGEDTSWFLLRGDLGGPSSWGCWRASCRAPWAAGGRHLGNYTKMPGGKLPPEGLRAQQRGGEGAQQARVGGEVSSTNQPGLLWA